MAALRTAVASDVPNLDEVPVAIATTAFTPPPSFTVIGHRGSGMNTMPSPASDPRLAAVKENSILSFNRAGRFPVDLVEFDVQVTRDGVPVIFHDVLILTADDEKNAVSEKRVTDLTLDEFLSYGPARESCTTNAKFNNKPLLRRGRDGGVFAWTVDADDHLCTLREAFQAVDPHLGFNIELKFDDDLDYKEEELSRALEAIMRVVADLAGNRPVIFSSFHPDAAVMARRMQGVYPVFFLTDGGTELFADPRRNSLDEAIKLCLVGGLQGIVSEVRGILMDPSSITRMREANLAVLTYGELNNVPEAVYMQHLMGIDGVIVDLVCQITEAVAGLIGGGGGGVSLPEEAAAVARPRFSNLELSLLNKLILPQLLLQHPH